MAKTPMDIALMMSKLPTCKHCNVCANPEMTDTEASSYKAKIRIVCPECGKKSDWYEYDNYCHAIPEMWNVLRMVFADFSSK